MFWGLAIEPGKRYMQTVGKSFHLSMASLERGGLDNETLSLMLEYEGQEYVLCNLNKQKVMQCQLDLNFKAGEKVAFYSAGQSRVHLTGYLLEEEDDFDDDDDDDDEEEEEEEEEANLADRALKKRKEVTSNPASNKKAKLDVEEESENDDDDDDDDKDVDDSFGGVKDEEEEEDEDDEEEDEDDESDSDEQPQVNNSSKSQQAKTPGDKPKKKEIPGQSVKTPNQQNGQFVQTPQSGKKNKNKEAGETPKLQSPQPGIPQKRVLQGGVVVQEIKGGNGPVAKPGSQVSVYYVGRLKQNNKQFDSSTSGPGFKFNLGRSEVIKGWDIGVAGMRVGGKRTITIPPQMAYGKKGQPPVIPPNSVLVFDVELRSVS